MPKVATPEEVRRMEFHEADRGTVNRRDKPVIQAHVVYLGSNPRMSVTLVGRVFQETFEHPDGTKDIVKTISSESGSTTPYPFWLRDLAGRIIKESTMPSTEGVPTECRGRPFVICEHPDHLVHFHTRRGLDKQPEFRVMFSSKAAKEAFDEYARTATNRRNRAESEYKETVA